jgi:hypothetical protein
MTAAVFVASHVFLYAMDEGDKSKQEAARNWRSALWTSRLGRLSFQVLGGVLGQRNAAAALGP